jgi:predicted Rossmann fold nucleotide-binding protein DprA/Smf involved in DNA uptake
MIDLTDRQRLIVSHLSVDPVHVDALIERTELSAQEVLQELTLLSLKGVVKRIDGQSFIRSKSVAPA